MEISDKVSLGIWPHRFFNHNSYCLPGMMDTIGLLFMVAIGVLMALMTVGMLNAVSEKAAQSAGMLIAYPFIFLPSFVYVFNSSQNHKYSTTGYHMDNDHFGDKGFVKILLLCLILIAALNYITDLFNEMMPPMPQWMSYYLLLMTGGSVATTICVCIISPILQEWLCRGVVLRGLLRHMNPMLAILISSVFFALIHVNLWQAVPSVIIGFGLGYVYYKTGSLKLTILMQMFNNTFMVIMSRNVEARNWREFVSPSWLYFIFFAAACFIIYLIYREFRNIPMQDDGLNFDPIPAKIKGMPHRGGYHPL